jgi:DNA repair ATPase RecN
MKRIIIIIVLCTSVVCSSYKASAQVQELEQLALDIEKLLQFKQILSDLKKGYEILSGGYNTIKNISQGNFNLHKTFLDGLMAVSPAVKKYKKVADIIDFQLQLVKEYKKAFNRFKQNGNFNPDEIDYIGKVYGKLFDESLKNLDALINIITADKLRMSDDERLTAIDGIYDDMQNKLSFLRYFNNNTTVLAVQRAKEKNGINTSRSLYGIEK